MLIGLIKRCKAKHWQSDRAAPDVPVLYFGGMTFHDSQVWAPVVAALGASVLTALAALGIAAWQARRASRNDLLASRRSAYARLLSVTGIIVHSAWMLRVTQDIRSGLGEGIDVAFRLRKPIDPIEFDTWMRRDLEPLYGAWSDVWTVGSEEAISIGNQVVELAGEVLGSATRKGEARGQVATWALGEKWTAQQFDEWFDIVRDLGVARRLLATLARQEIGVDIAELLSEPSELSDRRLATESAHSD